MKRRFGKEQILPIEHIRNLGKCKQGHRKIENHPHEMTPFTNSACTRVLYGYHLLASCKCLKYFKQSVLVQRRLNVQLCATWL